MNIAWSSLVVAFLFLLPGFIGLSFYNHSNQRALPRFGLGSDALIGLLGSLVLHTFLVLNARIFGLFEVDYGSLLLVLAGRLGIQEADSVAEVLQQNETILTCYFVTLYALAACVGLAAGALVSRVVSPAAEHLTFINRSGVYTFMDVLTKDGDLFQGLYHSKIGNEDEGTLAICLALTRRFRGERSQTSSDQEFEPVQPHLTVRDILNCVRQVYALDRTLDDPDTKLLHDVRERGLDGLLDDYRRESPQMIIPWREIANINMRQIGIGPINSGRSADSSA